MEKVKEDYELNLEELCKDWQGPEEGEEINLDEIREECVSLKKSIDRLGNVNLEALDEEQELDERYAFMASQEKDLRDAAKRLTEVVKHIDIRARESFMETYDKVRENFKISFRQSEPLSDGGGIPAFRRGREPGKD